MKLRRWFPALVVALVSVFALSGCKSPHIGVTVVNQTGGTINLVEVDYPSASFGVDSMANGGSYHYLIQVRLSGPIKAQYTDAASKIVKVTGPELQEGQQGSMTITLLPEGKADFQPQLESAK